VNLVRRRRRVLPLVGALAVASLAMVTPATASPASRPWLDVGLFAPVPAPGHPEGIVTNGAGTVYVSTHMDATETTTEPSRVFAFDRYGALRREYPVTGQKPTHAGLLAMALDGKGRLYVLDRDPSRILRIDPVSGAQTTYATFSDVPACVTAGQKNCSATVADLPAYADYLVFAPDGTLYVTDLRQALIWRVPRGGGAAEVWFTAPELEGIFGPNGIQFTDNGRTLLFAQSLHGVMDPADIPTGHGRLYTLPINRDGSAGTLDLFWEGATGQGPDGFAIGASGNVYVADALSNALRVLSPRGQEIASTRAADAAQEVPFNMPASVAFLGDRVLVTNQAYFGGTAAEQAVLDVYVADRAKPLFRPWF